ncbi:MAG: phage holin family protein [Chloroflexota bacterium]|nr:phage holin family protein [Chloroflexota bacterium]
MRTLLLRWAVIVIAVFLIAWGLPAVLPDTSATQPLIQYADFGTLAIFAAILALLNTFVRPILKLLSAPLSCMTFGLFGIVINTALFFLAAALVPSMRLSSIWAALVGAIAVSVVGAVMNSVTGPAR